MSSSLAHAHVRIRDLSDGTHLSVTMADNKVRLTAPGMEPIEAALPVGDLVVNDDLRDGLTDLLLGHYVPPGVGRGWLWAAVSLFAAEEGSGISL